MIKKILTTVLVCNCLVLCSNVYSLGNKHCDESRATFGSAVRIHASNGAPICGGVLISDRAVLSAASCFTGNQNSIALKMHVQTQNSTITPCITLRSGTNECVARLFTVRVHPNFNHSKIDSVGMMNDAEDNIAIAYINKNNLRYKGRSIPSSDFARLYSGKWQNSRNQIRTGFGKCRPNGKVGTYREKAVRPEKFYDNHFYHKAKSNNFACRYDQGSPSFLREQSQVRPVVVGIFSDFEFKRNGNTDDTPSTSEKQCALTAPSAKERFTKVSPKAAWISQQLKQISGRGCRKPFQNVDGVDYQLCFD